MEEIRVVLSYDLIEGSESSVMLHFSKYIIRSCPYIRDFYV